MADANDDKQIETPEVTEVTQPEETTNEPAEQDAQETQVDESDVQETDKEAEPKEATESEETESKEESPAEDDEAARKRHNDEMAKKRIASNHKVRQDILKTVDENYSPKTEQDLISEGLSEQDAKLEALRQEMQFRETRNYIADLNTGLKNDAEIVIRDHPIYDSNSPEYDPEFTKDVEEAYKVASRLQVDENGVVLNAEVGLHDFYSRMAKIRERGNVKGQVDGQKDALKMLSRTEPVSSTNTKPAEKSPEDMSIQEMEAKYGIVRR